MKKCVFYFVVYFAVCFGGLGSLYRLVSLFMRESAFAGVPRMFVYHEQHPMLYIGMSACLAGAVCGDHCSPISDTTIMASAGSQSNHLNHVSTQLPYAMTVAGVSFVTYVIAGFVQKAYIALPIGILLMIGTLFVIKAASKKKA